MNINEHIQRELLNEYGGSEKKKTTYQMMETEPVKLFCKITITSLL